MDDAEARHYAKRKFNELQNSRAVKGRGTVPNQVMIRLYHMTVTRQDTVGNRLVIILYMRKSIYIAGSHLHIQTVTGLSG